MHDDEPDDEDWYDEAADVDATVPCPECGAEIYDDADQCPRCGHWIIDDVHHAHEIATGPRQFVRVVAIVMLVILLASLLLAGSMF